VTKSQQSLLNVLRLQQQVGEALVSAVTSATAALRAFRVDEVDDLNKTVETLALRARSLEEARHTVMKNLAVELGISAEGLTIERLASAIGDPDGRAMRDIRDAVNRALTLVARINDDNRMIAQASLTAVQGLVRVIRQHEGGALIYGPTAVVGEPGANGRMKGRI
jgi:hypothetical protein